MGSEYLRIQIYFPKGEAKLYRAIEALAYRRGVSMAKVARDAVKQYLEGCEVSQEALLAEWDAEAKDAPEFQEPCRHRAFIQGGTVSCKVHADVKNVAGCVGCTEYEPR